MKNTLVRILGWVALVFGVLFVAMPIIPGTPLLIVAATLFSAT